MTEISPIRLWVMRAMYLVMAAGIGLTIWPLIVSHDPALPRMTGVAFALLGTVGLLALPILLFEFVWKTIWLLRFGLPQWLAGTGSPRLAEDLFGIGLGPLVFGLVIPWGYVWRHYVKAPGDRWR